MIGLAVRAGKVKFGVFLASDACDTGKAKLVVVPTDLGNSNKRNLMGKCKNNSVPIIEVSDKATLSKATGKENTVALAILDDNFASAILKLYGGGANE